MHKKYVDKESGKGGLHNILEDWNPTNQVSQSYFFYHSLQPTNQDDIATNI
jgi:hypothetical protein